MLPSVTEILSPWANFSRVPDQVLARACERGKEVHAACAAHARGLFPLVGEEARPYFESFRVWFDEYVVEVISVEQEYVHPIWRYVGHPDLIIVVKGDIRPSICDLKTPAAKNKLWRAQLAAYKELALANDIDVHRVFSLRLKSTGKFPILDEYTDHHLATFTAFTNALSTYLYFKGGYDHGN